MEMEQILPGSSTSSSNQPYEKNTTTQIAQTRAHDEIDEDINPTLADTMSTNKDSENMRRMGRQQQLVRRFRLFSVASFLALATAAWELGMFLITPGLLDGGRPLLLYSTFWNFIGFAPINLSMAEMASMAPIAGAQYHWVSEFAPESLQKVLSYITGWTSTLAWQSGNAQGMFLVGTLVQSIISVNHPDYSFPAWHATLLVFGIIAIVYASNVFGNRVLPYWQNPVFALHIMAYFALIIPIWVCAPKATSSQVWTEFENLGGWSNMKMAALVGQAAGIYSQIGIDAAAHMSEEVKDAATAVPRAMMVTYIVNFIIYFPALVTLCYGMPVVSDALNDPTLYPAIYVLRQTMSPGWLTAFLVVTILLLMASNMSYLAAVTRDAFAFARDEGLPFSRWIAHVDPKRKIPQNACSLTCSISMALALIYLGSTTAVYAITSLCSVALLQSYCLSIGCVLWRRIMYPETLPPTKFSLGRYGIPLNIMAVVYSFWCFFWCFWPQASPVTAEGFNWASVLFIATLIGAAFDFVFRGRHKYHGPVTLVKGRYANASM